MDIRKLITIVKLPISFGQIFTPQGVNIILIYGVEGAMGLISDLDSKF